MPQIMIIITNIMDKFFRSSSFASPWSVNEFMIRPQIYGIAIRDTVDIIKPRLAKINIQ